MLNDFSKSRKGIALIEQLNDTLQNISKTASRSVSLKPVDVVASLPAITIDSSISTEFSTDLAMEALMKSYESELPNPIVNIIFGNLMTSMLIQVSHHMQTWVVVSDVFR